MGGHYDSWDVGEGVHDDGAACIAAWQALRIIDQLGLQPRRTLRVVLWTNEENGLRGGREYREALSDEEVANHVAAIEMDGGAERPVGFGFGLSGVDANGEEPDPKYERALARLQRDALPDGLGQQQADVVHEDKWQPQPQPVEQVVPVGRAHEHHGVVDEHTREREACQLTLDRVGGNVEYRRGVGRRLGRQ